MDNFLLYDFWVGNMVNEDVFAYSNRFKNERVLIIYHNKYAETNGFIKNSVGFAVKQKEDKLQIQKSLIEGLRLPIEGYCIFKDYVSGLEYIRLNQELHEKGLYLELHAFQCFLFMDFQIVNDNEFFHYAQLYDLLGGRGVHDIKETLHEIVYQPLLESFKKMVNINHFKNLLEAEKLELIIESTTKKITTFLIEVKKYSSTTEDITKLEKQILLKLITTLRLHKGLTDLEISSDLKSKLAKILPKSEFEWGLLFSWIFIHQLGRLISEKNYELKSRSLFDEWRLSKYIRNTLTELAIIEDEKNLDVGSIIKLMISHHNWSNSVAYSDKKFYLIFQSFFRDPELQVYLKVNRFQNILWYSAEEFAKFIRWIWLATIIDRITFVKINIEAELNQLMDYYQRIEELAKMSKYQVNELLEVIEKDF